MQGNPRLREGVHYTPYSFPLHANAPNWRLITVTLTPSNLKVFSIGVSKTRVFAGISSTTMAAEVTVGSGPFIWL